MKNKLTFLAILSVASISANAELICNDNANNCSNVSPNLGDTTQSADNSTSKVDQNNNSSAANPSNTTISPVNKNANNNDGSVTGGNVTGGNTSSTGGSSFGNKSDNRNDVNASNGANTNGDQSFKAGVDTKNTNNTAASNGNQTLTGGANHNSNGQGQSSKNNLANNNKTNNDVLNKLGQGQSSYNDVSTSDNRKQSSKQELSKSGNSNTRVDASDKSVTNYSSQALSRAPIVHGGVISLPSATMNTIVGECSPIPSVDTQPVYGTHIGVFKNKSVPLGFTQQISMNFESLPFNYFTAPDGAIYEMGVKSVITTSVNNMGSSRSVSASLSRALGEDVGGGAANSSSMQGQVTTVQLVPCVHNIFFPKTEELPVPKLEEVVQPDLDYLQYGMKG